MAVTSNPMSHSWRTKSTSWAVQGPLAELHGNTSVCIENHGGILEYTDTRVCIAVQRGTLTVSGCGLRILRMTQRRVEIGGTIRCVEVS